jgi:hypothetical protein
MGRIGADFVEHLNMGSAPDRSLAFGVQCGSPLYSVKIPRLASAKFGNTRPKDFLQGVSVASNKKKPTPRAGLFESQW